MKYYCFLYLFLVIFTSSLLYAEEPQTTFQNLGDYVKEHEDGLHERIPAQLQILQKRIANGDVEALFETGLFYFRGVEIERNIEKAIHYLTLAAEKKHPKALYNLASLYLDGTIVEQNIEKGLTYLEQAVKAQYIPAQVGYAFLYLDGTIVAQNIEKAYTYLALASHNRNITKDELREITEYKKNVAQKLTQEQVQSIEKQVKQGLTP